MNPKDLKNFEGRNCILIDSGRGRAVKIISFFINGEMLMAEIESISNNGFKINGNHSKREPFIKEWLDIGEHKGMGIGDRKQIGAQKEHVRWRYNYLYFSFQGYGGVKLYFNDSYVDKVKNRDSFGWDGFIMTVVRNSSRPKQHSSKDDIQ